MDSLAPLIAAALNAGTPLMLAALGLLINEKAGVVNLGAEGMMLVAAVVGFAVAVDSGSATLGFLAGAGAGMLLAAFFAWMTVWLGTNQIATGLALALFGAGASTYIGIDYAGQSIGNGGHAVPWLAELPVLGAALFRQHPVVYLALLLCVAIAWFLQRTRAGLVLRAVGESPWSAHAIGLPVRPIRLAAIVFGGACCGLAGAYMSLVYTPLWAEGMVGGRGWIALALINFATWRPLRVAGGAYLFGGVTILSFHAQALNVDVASQLLSMLPYIAAIVVLVLISRKPNHIKPHLPASLGKDFRP
ncbi:MAG: ABC transporter permease [Pseudomonadota bacterium]